MLRSIIAIWSFALGLVIVAACAGCGGEPVGGGAHTVDMAPAPDLDPACPMQCGSCAAGDFCFQGSFAAQLPSFCAHGCADDRDCANGEKCATLFAALQPSVCVSPTAPIGCGVRAPGWHCDLLGPTCKDDHTLSRPFSQPANGICGWELVHCDAGCDATVAAHCK